MNEAPVKNQVARIVKRLVQRGKVGIVHQWIIIMDNHDAKKMTTGQTMMNKGAPIHYKISVNDMVHRPL